jgi:hypothetical protein
MGSYLSGIQKHKLEDFSKNYLDYPNAWRYTEPKNYDYYFSDKRDFRVSRQHYPQFTRGYFYGYWYDGH